MNRRISLTVYEHPLSPYAQKVKIALREKGVDFTLSVPEAIGAGGAGGEFLAANPRAEVPALVDGDVHIFDSTIILEYIEDRWPTPALLPASPAERARVRMLEEVMDTHFEPINWAMGELNWFRRAEGVLADTLRSKATEQTRGFYAWLERELGDREWFNGAAFGWGDLSVVPYLNRSADDGRPPAEGSKLGAWLARVNTRPSVAQTTPESRQINIGDTNLAALLEQGLFKREYRDHRLEWMIKSGGVEVVLKGLERENIRFTPDFH
jgi:glutathione S-transferase/RNA polymerase-associated protein